MSEQPIKDLTLDFKNTVFSKYPDCENKNKFVISKLFTFVKILEDEKALAFMYDFKTLYENKTNSKMDAEDILNIAYSYNKNFEQLKELRVDNYRFYLQMMKGINIQEIFKLNSILLSNEVLDKMKNVRLNFSDEELFREFNDGVLTTELFKFKILRDIGIDKSMVLDRIKKEILEKLSDENAKVNQPLLRVKKNYTR